MNIILASKSPRRSELLSRAGVVFRAVDSDADETLPPDAWDDPAHAVRTLAARKAQAVARRLADEQEPCLVVGADTIVVVDGVVFGKPHDVQDAFRMIRHMAGRAHQVMTGVSVWRVGQGDCAPADDFTEISDVFFKNLTDQDIWDYLACGESMDKAGAYAIQGEGHVLVDHFEGDYDNIVGLPSSVPRMLEELS